MKISILGAGAFGTSLAINLSKKHPDVTLWSHDEAQINKIKSDKENKKYLNEINLPENLSYNASLDFVLGKSNVTFLCIPAQETAPFFKKHFKKFRKNIVVLCAKGIDKSSLSLQSEVMGHYLPENQKAVLTGPGFAREIALGKPTALTIACENKVLGLRLQTLISSENLRIYLSQDLIGAQIGGSLKNVIAIACGIVSGQELGESAKMALMTRGFAEMRRLGVAMGGSPDTFFGLSGIGDLALTCNSMLSRNFQVGYFLGMKKRIDSNKTVEGLITANAACKLAQRHNIDIPVIQTTSLILQNQISIETAMINLLSRPLKTE